MHRVPRVGSLVFIANIKNPVTYDNDLTRTINSHEANPSSSHEFENFFQKDLCIKMGLLGSDNMYVYII